MCIDTNAICPSRKPTMEWTHSSLSSHVLAWASWRVWAWHCSTMDMFKLAFPILEPWSIPLYITLSITTCTFNCNVHQYKSCTTTSTYSVKTFSFLVTHVIHIWPWRITIKSIYLKTFPLNTTPRESHINMLQLFIYLLLFKLHHSFHYQCNKQIQTYNGTF